VCCAGVTTGVKSAALTGMRSRVRATRTVLPPEREFVRAVLTIEGVSLAGSASEGRLYRHLEAGQGVAPLDGIGSLRLDQQFG
jgi:hypothetical protein